VIKRGACWNVTQLRRNLFSLLFLRIWSFELLGQKQMKLKWSAPSIDELLLALLAQRVPDFIVRRPLLHVALLFTFYVLVLETLRVTSVGCRLTLASIADFLAVCW
jgi:hypothetical protein